MLFSDVTLFETIFPKIALKTTLILNNIPLVGKLL